MRWWVEVTALDGQVTPVERAVEAETFREAIAQAGQSPSAGDILSLERLGPGWRLVDAAGRRYVVLPVPPSEVLPALLGAESLDQPPPSYELVVCRDHDPTPELPLAYRERGVRVASNVPAAAAAGLLRHLLDAERRSLRAFPTGKVIELAAFVGVFSTTELPPPLVTLSFRDWRGEAELGFLEEPDRVERVPVVPV